MSNQDGAVPFNGGSDHVVRGLEPTEGQAWQAHPVVQPQAGAWPVGGGEGSQGGAGHHARVQARPRKVQFGGNATLSREALEEAVLRRAKEAAAQEGKDLGSHLRLRSDFFFYDATGHEVSVDHVVVVVKE